MEQFSHDLTLALEETSRIRAGHYWGGRRRTRSTGNLPIAPQPTEDSSSQGDGNIEHNECQSNSILSDSDDRPNFQLVSRVRQACIFGNFESDSLNENLSPTRPSTRRKRKFKRMAVEYETTPSTPGNSNSATIFPIANNVVRKRVIKHMWPENVRAGLFFCGKRKRSHRDRYHDYDHYRLHSSSVPRQRDYFTPRNSYLEYRNRSRMAYAKPCERILPLNKNIVSRIEKISQDSANGSGAIGFGSTLRNDERNILAGFVFSANCPSNGGAGSQVQATQNEANLHATSGIEATDTHSNTQHLNKSASIDDSLVEQPHVMPQKSGSFDATIISHENRIKYATPQLTAAEFTTAKPTKDNSRKVSKTRQHKRKQTKHHQMQMQIQFGNPIDMDCGSLNDFLSSSSLSSSDSEGDETNESDREGDDELTDWPGNEAMVNFASKNDFKRAKSTRQLKAATLQGKVCHDDLVTLDEDTLMFAEDIPISPTTSHFPSTSTVIAPPIISPAIIQGPNPLALQLKLSLPSSHRSRLSAEQVMSSPSTSDIQIPSNPLRAATSMPINIIQQATHHAIMGPTLGHVESEMSGETSNHFLSSSQMADVREIRAGCRRVHNERPGYSIFSSINEHLSRFLQDSHQTRMILPYTHDDENDKLVDLAKLYSLKMEIENGQAIFYKTNNTTQSVKIDHTDMPRFFLSDYKRRCYGFDDDSEPTEMAS